ncbi:BA14K family protein [Bradyrhizobium diazoefficiens]|nr:BA14K family protein [Bradyrhizobium diazoefficiens]MBR0775462.1 BA14K family protein [Bradyrhizobium diazoefficiens]MBR0849882.1 BA14K family protein [Bradyrhizobium diazoefficiens]
MTSLKVLSAAAAVALVLPLATPSFAQGVRGGGGAHIGGGGGGAHFGGGGGARMGGGASFGAGAGARMGGGGFTAAARPSGGAAFVGGRNFAAASGNRSFAAAGGNHWNGGNWNGGRWHRHGGGFWPGVAAGATIGALGSYAYYGGGYYDDPYYYDDGYYDSGASVAVVPDGGGDSAAYCAQRYRSYDPASGTYLGYDGQRHPCP